jgi:type I restriction-modification system DNA methylase subunit
MLQMIKHNPELMSVFRDHTFIWWNRPDILCVVEPLIRKYVEKDSLMYGIVIQFKMSIESMIDRPQELLELIDSCLKPKQKEKQENGEVFTPMKLVFEMLEKLDKHYIKEHAGQSIFTVPGLKWFDPASGMGNFPVAVYLKLMEGLKPQFPQDDDRKKHIIENMLYMSELNKKNVHICRQIFSFNGKYTMNMHEGDTLKLDVSDTWGIAPRTFDVVLGNPPYNKGGIRSHTGEHLGEKNETIWTKFIEKSFESWLKPDDGFLAFINPLSWLKKSHSLHTSMLNKHIVWLKLWDNIKSLATINGKIPISLYVLQNTTNHTNKKTEIISEIQSKKVTTTSHEYLNPAVSIPLAFHSIFNKLINFIQSRQLRLEYKTKTVKSSGIKTKIPSVYIGRRMGSGYLYHQRRNHGKTRH